MLNIAIFGAPGAGKGTQAQSIIEKYNLKYISTGNILRAEIANGTPLGLEAKAIIEKGNLVSDELVTKIIEKFISDNRNPNGFLFDGFPRTCEQAKSLDRILKSEGTELSCLLNMDVPREELIKRMMHRAKLENRADDTPEVFENRLKEYEEKTFPVMNYYQQQNKVLSVSGVGTIEEIFVRLTEKIDSIK
ncbi:MAG: adenylate kinase [Bacteroidales bacterium]|nr:adenylate kinase [Bacteroidales bacterium]